MKEPEIEEKIGNDISGNKDTSLGDHKKGGNQSAERNDQSKQDFVPCDLTKNMGKMKGSELHNQERNLQGRILLNPLRKSQKWRNSYRLGSG